MKRINFIVCMAAMISFFITCTPKEVKETVKTGVRDSEIEVLRIGAANDFKYGIQDSLSLITDFLTGLDENLKPIPGLIERWETNADSTEFKLHLKKGVLFHDGAEFTADDCKYDLEVLAKNYYAAYLHSLSKIDVKDTYTLIVSFKNPVLSFIDELFKIPAFPANCVNAEGMLVKYIGTGSFILKDYKKDVEATLIKNENYWNKEKIPAIKEIKWLVIPEDEARSLALEAEQVDVIGYSEHGKSLDFSTVASFRNKKGFGMIQESKAAYTSVNSLSLNWLKAPLNDPALRKALCYTIDRKALAETVFFGEVIPMGQMMNPAFEDCSKKVEAFTTDIEKAKEILKDAGYIVNEKGMLLKQGKPVELLYLSSTATADKELAEFVQADFKKIGIQVTVALSDPVSLLEKRKNGGYDMSNSVFWFEPSINAIGFYGLEAQDPFGYGLGFGITDEVKNAGGKILAAKNKKEFTQACDEFWLANYEACPSIPIMAAYRTAFFNDAFAGFKYNPNYFVIDLSQVKRK